MIARIWAKFGIKRVLATLAFALFAPWLALFACAAREPLPSALRESGGWLSTRVLDRDGRTIREVRSRDGKLSSRVSLGELSPFVVPALLAAEDARFYRHPGVDPIAMLRALGQALWHRRIVSGASTLTQQLARAVVERPRTAAGKWHELVVALRIEANLSKSQILEEYLNRVEFGPNVRGIEAASRFYFDKPATDLDLAEAATLVSIPRGPSLYDPTRGTRRVLLRRDRVLARMLRQGLATTDAVRDARLEPLQLQRGLVEGGSEHLVQGLLNGALTPELRGEQLQSVSTMIDSNLQREVAELARRAARDVTLYGASALSVIVVDNATGGVLAYLGSPDFLAQRSLGQNDGVRALRQPGSALKPFVYAEAMTRLGMTPATLLPDLELHLPTSEGDYAPKNYDGRFHGPVRLREALQNSLNVPAVYAASRVGPEHVLELLHQAGFNSLENSAAYYGVALALGDGEVKLSELAQAYAMLARGGKFLPLGYYTRARLGTGSQLTREAPSAKPVIDPRVAALLTDILADDLSRSAEFGIGGALAFPFPVAAKTGTSKGFRDNWTVGFSHEVTVAVWAGNFDGTPMTGSTGITGAGPLFHEVMLAAMRGRTPAPLVEYGGLEAAEICELSGQLAGASCSHHRREWFVAGQAPRATCDMHERVRLDPDNGLRAGPNCAFASERVFEHYPAEYENFARRAGRPLAPRDFSPRCPGLPSDGDAKRPQLSFPQENAEFLLDPALRPDQEIVLEARANTDSLTFYVDERRLGTLRAPFRLPWRLTPGTHRVRVAASDGASSEPIAFEVR
ncbi:MAG TPA: penicillin-binding protein 1C [Polyangiaceae bacterium]|jgi:penicillin-binding protein 1C|nr:penicillin-binding protein 1C [Polyangiaceae bacterium]